jgi:putative DNA primase/helicase
MNSSSGGEIREGMGQAYYRPAAGYISLLQFDCFKSADTFYATAFHELGHATGHKSCLDLAQSLW